MKFHRLMLAAAMIIGAALPASAKVDMAILPGRDTVQLTIYNSADLTLVREQRSLTLQKGLNRLQFSWANTLIDPTSLDMLPRKQADRIDIQALTFPPRTQNLGLWQVDSRVGGDVPVEISYLTSGLSWRAFYLGTLSTDETAMRLQGFVRVTNGSGEDYDNAQVRLIVGKVHLIDEIAALARRRYPYGTPSPQPVPAPRAQALEADSEMRAKVAFQAAESVSAGRPKEIVKEGLSEYFLYTIEGRESIANGWSKRLPSFDAGSVPVVNLYKYEAERFGDNVVRFLHFRNDRDHRLGQTPIPGGAIKVFRSLDEESHLAYEGQSRFQYIPVEEKAELNLGPVDNVLVTPTLMDVKTDRYLFNNNGDISGWDDVQTWRIEVNNTRAVPVKVEIRRNFDTASWKIDHRRSSGDFEKIDLDTVQFSLQLKPQTREVFEYVLTLHRGQRAD